MSQISLVCGRLARQVLLCLCIVSAAPVAFANPTTEMQLLLDEAVRSSQLPSAELRVYRSSDDKMVLSLNSGGFNSQEPLEIASATKWATAATFLVLISQGSLRLDSTTGEVLGWEGRLGDITLRQLLSFTSGLDDHLCTKNRARSLESCTRLIERANRRGPSKDRVYSYNAADYTVAGRMAEVVLGQPWVEIFETALRQPLGLSRVVNYWGIWLGG